METFAYMENEEALKGRLNELLIGIAKDDLTANVGSSESKSHSGEIYRARWGADRRPENTYAAFVVAGCIWAFDSPEGTPIHVPTGFAVMWQPNEWASMDPASLLTRIHLFESKLVDVQQIREMFALKS